jgi:hypothetical protein
MLLLFSTPLYDTQALPDELQYDRGELSDVSFANFVLYSFLNFLVSFLSYVQAFYTSMYSLIVHLPFFLLR